jgi:diguanylate cyclase (GGDEF)-like protein
MGKDNNQDILSQFIEICILEIDKEGSIKDILINTKEDLKIQKTIYKFFTKENHSQISEILKLSPTQIVTTLKSRDKILLKTYLSNQKIYVGLIFLDNEIHDEDIENLKHKAEVDELTGLLNRRGYWRRVKSLLTGNDPERKLGILMMDIDDLKHVNDTYGHQKGDRAIKDLGMLIRKEIRVRDIASRWGGDEFIIVVEEMTGKYSTAYGLAKRLHRQLTKIKGFPTTVSIGVHIVRVGDFRNFKKDEDKLRKAWDKSVNTADQLLYSAKGLGKNRIVKSDTVSDL